jgi:hypothetical protein
VPAPARPLTEYPTVQAWLKGLEEQWGELPSDADARVDLLARFCALVEKEPDEMIEESSREVDSGKRIRIKVRRFYSEKIEEFQEGIEGDARARGRAANVIRSFFIHNGIFMQGGLQGQ